MRKKDDTLRAVLLSHARDLADAEGIGAVNIRSLARRAGVATGTVYNYFSSKDEILLSLTEEDWARTLEELRGRLTASSFDGQLEQLFTFLRARIDASAGALMRSLGSVDPEGQARMVAMQGTLGQALLRRMDLDPAIRRDIWDGDFSRERFARFLVAHLTLLLRAPEPDVGFFLALVRRILY